jgi:hypothetical protein
VRVGESLAVVGNPVLENLDGLAGIRLVGREVDIVDNPLVPQAAIDELLARVGLTP